MRRLIASISAVALAAGFTVAFTEVARATVTSPTSNQVLRGTVTFSDSGVSDGTACLNGTKPNVTFRLINAANVTVFSQNIQSTSAVTSNPILTESYANGSYTLRVDEQKRSGFLGCSNSTTTINVPVSIDNVVVVQYSGSTHAPQNTSTQVQASVFDPNLTNPPLAGMPVTFALSGSTTTVVGVTNSLGVATAVLPINGGPRNATVSATTPANYGTAQYAAKSATSTFAVEKNGSKTTLDAPAAVVHGQGTQFVAHVTRLDGSSTPTGTVQFQVDGSNFGSPVTVDGTGTAATPITTSLSTATHTVNASYSGDANFLGSAASTSQTVGKASTTTTLVDDPTPSSTYGQSTTFRAQVAVVAPGAGAPTGSVQFNIDGQPFGIAVPLAGDTATLVVSSLHTGNHDVTATYNGDADFSASDSNAVTHGVRMSGTTVTLTGSDPSAVSGESLTYRADLAAVDPGTGTPGGQVQFYADGNPIGDPVTLVNGSATSPAISFLVGSHPITVDYLGTGDYAGSSDNLTQTVTADSTTVAISSDQNPSVFGQPVPLHAVVTADAPGSGTPTGTVQFYADGIAIGPQLNLVDGQTEPYSVSTLSRATHAITAVYSGETEFSGSTSEVLDQTVGKASTKVTLASSSPTSVFGQPVTLTATVAVLAPGAGNPSGTITFKDGSTVLGTVDVDSSTGEQASLTTADLSVAQHAISASYSGDDSFNGSTGSTTQTVLRAQSSTLVASSANPARTGQGITFTATVTPVAPGAGSPTGTVKFTVNGAQLGAPAPVVDGVATSTAFASLTPGTYQIVATYSGDRNFVTSKGSLDQGAGQNVTKGDTTMTFGSDGSPAAYGATVTLTSTVTAVAPATRHPSGEVQFWDGDTLLGSSSLVSASAAGVSTAAFAVAGLSPGSHALRSVYVGNFNFNGQSASLTQQVGQIPTVVGVESLTNPATFGSSFTLSAVVTANPAEAGDPTGTITFTEGGAVLGSATVQTVQGRQQASITVSGLHAGAHQIQAVYSGDTDFAGSTSAPFTQNVARAASKVEAATLITYSSTGGLQGNGGRVRATLTGVGGVPLAGQTIVFSTTQSTDHSVIHICDAVTDATGTASCDATALIIAIDNDGGYDAAFAGNNDYLPSHDHGTQF